MIKEKHKRRKHRRLWERRGYSYEEADWTCSALRCNRDAVYAFYDESVCRAGSDYIVSAGRL